MHGEMLGSDQELQLMDLALCLVEVKVVGLAASIRGKLQYLNAACSSRIAELDKPLRCYRCSLKGQPAETSYAHYRQEYDSPARPTRTTRASMSKAPSLRTACAPSRKLMSATQHVETSSAVSAGEGSTFRSMFKSPAHERVGWKDQWSSSLFRQ